MATTKKTTTTSTKKEAARKAAAKKSTTLDFGKTKGAKPKTEEVKNEVETFEVTVNVLVPGSIEKIETLVGINPEVETDVVNTYYNSGITTEKVEEAAQVVQEATAPQETVEEEDIEKGPLYDPEATPLVPVEKEQVFDEEPQDEYEAECDEYEPDGVHDGEVDENTETDSSETIVSDVEDIVNSIANPDGSAPAAEPIKHEVYPPEEEVEKVTDKRPGERNYFSDKFGNQWGGVIYDY